MLLWLIKKSFNEEKVKRDTSNYEYNILKQLISSCNVIMKLTLIDYYKAIYFPYKIMDVMTKKGNEIRSSES